MDEVLQSRLSLAVERLRAGELVGMPTETVYGLAADASNADAVQKIFALKGRPADHPVIVHLPDASQLSAWASSVPEAARKLADRFWPGPLTLILPRASHVNDLITGGQNTVGLRIPAHPIAKALLREFGCGLAAPSANRYGHISPTTAAHVQAEFGDALMVLDGGPCVRGIESTIVDLSGEQPRILRPGSISLADIEALIGPIASGVTAQSPRASGLLESHYAPRTPARLLGRSDIAAVAQTAEVLVLSCGPLPDGCHGIALATDPVPYAHALYASLRELDARNCSLILIEQPPLVEEWAAVNDRLARATAKAAK